MLLRIHIISNKPSTLLHDIICALQNAHIGRNPKIFYQAFVNEHRVMVEWSSSGGCKKNLEKEVQDYGMHACAGVWLSYS